MADRSQSGVLDTCTYIDLDQLDPEVLPEIPELDSGIQSRAGSTC